ncbi:MAG: DUF1922 domain-containing protein [Planctomycetota bacterium]
MRFHCPKCNALLSAGEHLAGKTIACKCGHQFKAPTPAAAPKQAPKPTVVAKPASPGPKPMVQASPVPSSPVQPTPVPAPTQDIMLRCPCGKQLKAAASARGKTVRCSCGKMLKVPGQPAQPAHPNAAAAPIQVAPLQTAPTPAPAPMRPEERLGAELQHIAEVEEQRAFEEEQRAQAASAYRPLNQMTLGGGDEETLRSKYIHHEAAVRGIGALFYFSGGYAIFTAVILTLVVTMGILVDIRAEEMGDTPEARFWNSNGPYVVIGIATVMGIFFTILAASLQALQLWAKIVATIICVLGMIGVPIFGTALYAYCLYLLYCPEGNFIFTKPYLEARKKTPHMQPGISTFFQVLLTIFVLLIIASFVWNMIAGVINA